MHTQRVQHRKLISGGKETDVGTENAADYQLPGEEISYRLTDERRKRLEEIGFVWSAREGDKAAERVTRNSYDSQWDAMFSRLLEYKAKNGDCLGTCTFVFWSRLFPIPPPNPDAFDSSKEICRGSKIVSLLTVNYDCIIFHTH